MSYVISDNLLETFENNILEFIFNSLSNSYRANLQKHDKHFSKGDFSFPLLFRYWLNNQNDTLKNNITKIFQINHDQKNDEQILCNLIEKSHGVKWSLKLNYAFINQDRVILFLDRSNAFCQVLKQACFLNENDLTFNHHNHYPKLSCDLDVDDNKINEIESLTLTQWRMYLIKNFIKNLLKINENPIQNKIPRIHISTKNNNIQDLSCKYIFCAPIINIEDSKKSTVDVHTYIELRMIDLQRENQEDNICKAPSYDLVIAASSLELLGAKTQQPLQLRLNCKQIVNRQNSNRGAIFILYNYARIATLLNQFEESVKLNYYPKLIDFDQINWSLLDKEEEWVILFNFIMIFPNIIKELIKEIDSVNQKGFNLRICTSFLSNLALAFSKYYRRYRILVEPRPQLLPTLFARIYLLKGLRNIFLYTLNILNIKSFEHL